MHPHLTAQFDATGHVCAELPPEWLWEFVEYLSFQRLNTHYHYGTTHFKVVFPNQEMASIQRLLDDWSTSPAEDFQEARNA